MSAAHSIEFVPAKKLDTASCLLHLPSIWVQANP
jgi:hypothetical protein